MHRIQGEKRDDERLQGNKDGDFCILFHLGGDEFFRKDNHNNEWNDGNGSKTGSLYRCAQKEEAKEAERNDSESYGNTGKGKESKFFEQKSNGDTNENHTDINSDAVFDADDQKRKDDECGSINTERLNADDLPKKSDEGDHKREKQKKAHCFEWDALFERKLYEGVEGKHRGKG